VLAGGDLSAKVEKVEAGFLKEIVGKEEPAQIPFVGYNAVSKHSTGLRLALANWIASPENPLTARVMANRIWQHHFGEGIIRTPSDVGMSGERPTHPELLDWLALQFIEKEWSIKEMHKLMLTSNAYRQSAEHEDWKQHAGLDPDNRLLWRMNWSRLESEAIRDSILAVSGRLQKSEGGPGVFFKSVADVAASYGGGRSWFVSGEKEQGYRSVYGFQRRSVVMPMMEAFDTATMSESCPRRHATTVATQVFSLMNSEFVQEEAKHFAERVIELAGPDRTRQVDRAFRLALNRDPSAREKEKASEFLSKAGPVEGLAHLGVVLFNSNEFIYLD
jgi:hypothetical protein